jgi:hypothetical protein
MIGMKIGLSKKIGLFAISVFLSWRLLRFSDLFFDYWNFYHYILGILYVLSAFFASRYLLKRRIPIFSFYVILFVIVGLFNKLIFPGLDTFSVAFSTFILYFLLERVLRNVHYLNFFHCFQFVLTVLLFMNFLDFINLHFLSQTIFDYAKAVEGIAGIDSVGTKSNQFLPGLISFVGRAPGVSGTTYATSALIAASAIFFFLRGSMLTFVLSSILLFLWATGSSFIVFLFVLLILNRKRKTVIFVFFITIILGYIAIIGRGGFSLSPYLVYSLELKSFEFLFALIFGEGRHVSSFATELRIWGMLLSLGLICTFLLAMMMGNYWSFLKRVRHDRSYSSFRAGFWFILTLFLSNWHYQTFFIFPNMALVVALLAFVSLQISVSRTATIALK